MQLALHRRGRHPSRSSKRWFRCWTAGKWCKFKDKSRSRCIDATPNHRNWNKVRIVALYIQYRDGVPDEDRRRLFQHARLSLQEQDAVSALRYLGARIARVGISSPFLTLVAHNVCVGTRRSRHEKEDQTKDEQRGRVCPFSI